MLSMFRAILKFFGFLWISARALADFCFNVRRDATVRRRADWCHRWSKTLVRLLNIEVVSSGAPPARGLLTSNHLSYIDIIVLGSIYPQIFLSKAEVRNWPIIGALTRCAGTLFVRRERKADVAELQGAFAEVVSQSVPLTLFPEGTSSDGSSVLPFFSSLLEPAANANWPVTPACIGYRLDEGHGIVAEDICYWGDMTFGRHLWKLLGKKKIYVSVTIGEPIEPGLNRKEMAAALHNKVSAMAAKKRPQQKDSPELTDDELEPSFN
jgi:1-acyl-sn-glycerol-3-phosphate acyltransferase